MAKTATQTQMQGDITGLMREIGVKARRSARVLALASTVQKNAALVAMAASIRKNCADILTANKKDLEAARARGTSGSFLDRLMLDNERLEAVAASLEDIAALADPVGDVIASWERPNGLQISRVRTPLGVIGIIYESRPNVTSDAGALCLKSGNAVILRGGSESFYSSRAIHACLIDGLKTAGLPCEAIQIVPTTDRAAVAAMLHGLDGNIDVIVPRGGKGLIAMVQQEARVPVFSHLEGICHVYVDKAANLAMAREITLNAKMRRTGICGAAETLLVDRACADTHLAPLIEALLEAGCEVRGDTAAQQINDKVIPARPEDWSTEYLDAIISVKLIDGVEAAARHIAEYGSSHTETIITDDEAAAAAFFAQVDSAIVMHNASTQYADGGEFGMGAEIGIATGKMHARGPVGVEQLTSFKYTVRGTGQTRPK